MVWQVLKDLKNLECCLQQLKVVKISQSLNNEDGCAENIRWNINTMISYDEGSRMS